MSLLHVYIQSDKASDIVRGDVQTQNNTNASTETSFCYFEQNR